MSTPTYARPTFTLRSVASSPSTCGMGPRTRMARTRSVWSNLFVINGRFFGGLCELATARPPAFAPALTPLFSQSISSAQSRALLALRERGVAERLVASFRRSMNIAALGADADAPVGPSLSASFPLPLPPSPSPPPPSFLPPSSSSSSSSSASASSPPPSCSPSPRPRLCARLTEGSTVPEHRAFTPQGSALPSPPCTRWIWLHGQDVTWRWSSVKLRVARPFRPPALRFSRGSVVRGPRPERELHD